MATGETVGKIKTAKLVELYGDIIEVRKSTKEGAKYPYYLSTNCGPLPCNTKRSQDFLQDNAVTYTEAKLEKKPEETKPEPEKKPEQLPEIKPEAPEEEDNGWLL